MKIVLTGGTGFIGSYLIRSLAANHELTCLVRDPSKLPQDSQVTAVQGDLGVAEGLSGLPQQADAVLHFAQANVPFPDSANELFEVNAGSTERLADYARRAGATRFIYASSGSVYAQNAGPLSEESPLGPQGLYALTKQVSEGILECYKPYFNVGVLRLFAPYGPHQTGRMFPGIIGRVRSGQQVALTNEGQPRVNPIFIDDVVRIVDQALALSSHYLANVGGPAVVSVADIATLAGNVLGSEPQFEHRTDPAVWNLIADTTKLHATFSLPDLVSPAEGIRRMVEASNT